MKWITLGIVYQLLDGRGSAFLKDYESQRQFTFYIIRFSDNSYIFHIWMSDDLRLYARWCQLNFQTNKSFIISSSVWKKVILDILLIVIQE